jgi:hypothetical protein
MNPQQELANALKELELAKAGLKAAGGDAQKVHKLESKTQWLEDKVEKLRKKSQS